MSRRRRTIEILTAAQLAPQELAIERERTRRQQGLVTGALQALSMLPTAGANIATTVAGIEADKLAKAEKVARDAEAATRQKALDALAEENTRSQITAREAEAVRAGAAETRAAAQEARAQAQADAMSKKSALEEAAAAREAAMEALRARARSGANLPTLIGAASADDRLGDLDDDAVAGVLAEETAKAEQADALRKKTLQQAEPKPAKAKGPMSAEAQEVADAKRRKVLADAKAAEARATALEKAGQGGAGGGKMLPPGEINDLALERNNLKALADIRALKKDINTGGIMGRIQSGSANVVDNAKWARFTTAVQVANKLLARAVEGGRMTDADAAFYQRILANPNLDDDSFNAVVDFMESMAKETLEGKASALREAGYAVPASFLPAPAAAPDPAAKAEADALFAD